MRTNSPIRRAEQGSAYLMVLVLLVVLTMLGLALSVVTQTEVFIGGAEKQSTRQLYSAANGIQLASVYELVARDSAKRSMKLGERSENLFGGLSTIGDRVCTTPYLQIHTSVCNLCMLNQDNEYFAVQNGVTSSALRHGNDDIGARRTVGAVVAFEPWQRSPVALQMTSEASITDLTDSGTIDIDASTEVDPCEGLFLKI